MSNVRENYEVSFLHHKKVIFLAHKLMPRCKNDLSRVMRKPTMLFQDRFDINRAVQAHKMARDWKYTIRVTKTKALISIAVTAKLICAFVFAYAKCWFSHGAAQL